MMKYIGLILLLLGLTECEQLPDKAVTYSNVDCESMGFVNVRRWRTEVLSIDSMTINGNFPLVTAIDNYKNEFGRVLKTYSIQEEDIALYGSDYYSDSDKKTRYVFKGALVDTRKDRAIINTIDFVLNDVKIIHPRIVLKKGMSPIEIGKLFPRSCRLVPQGGNAWSGFVVLHGGVSDSDWRRVVLIFRGEELIKMRIVSFRMD